MSKEKVKGGPKAKAWGVVQLQSGKWMLVEGELDTSTSTRIEGFATAPKARDEMTLRLNREVERQLAAFRLRGKVSA